MGAAIWAGIKKGLCKECLLLQATPKSIGIGLKDDEFKPIIKKNSIVPIMRKDTFTTTKDNQQYINVSVFEGENTKVIQNRKIIDLEFGPLANAKAGEPKIEVTLDMDVDSILRVKVKDLN